MLRCTRNLTASLIVSCLILLGGINGCAKTQQMQEPLKTGFLGDYSMLRPGQEGRGPGTGPAVGCEVYRKSETCEGMTNGNQTFRCRSVL